MEGFLYYLPIQFTLESFVFMSVTSRLNLFLRNNIFSDTILSTGLAAFVCWIYVINLIQTKLISLVQTKATLPIDLPISTTKSLLCGIFNSSVIICSLVLMYFYFFVVTLVDRWLIFSSIADITACLHSEKGNVVTLSFSYQDRLHDFIHIIMVSLAFC